MKKIVSLFVLISFATTAFAQPYAIGHTTITYNDPSRSNRSVSTEIYYPASIAGNNVPVTGTAYPLLVFGHGFVMTWSAYQNIWTAFVPSGYIVAFPTTETGISPVHADFGMDLAFLVGKLQSEGITNSSSIFYNHVGTTSAIMGHSMGGGSSFLACENNTSVTTMVTFAAANTTPPSISAATHISIPSLVIAGQNDCVAPPAQHQIPMYDSLASSCKAYVEINGGGHCYFAENNFNCSFGEGTCTPNPTITRLEQEDAAQDMALLWLNYYLKGDCSAWQNFNDSLGTSNRFTSRSSCTSQFPIISQMGNYLSSTSATTYQWLLNGIPIAGAVNQTYTPVQNGNYSVVVTYSSPCSDTSNVLNWNVNGLPDAPEISFLKIFPNPGNGNFQMSFQSALAGNAKIIVMNTLGQMVSSQTILVQRGQNQLDLDLNAEAAGCYSVRLIFENGQSAQIKILKQ